MNAARTRMFVAASCVWVLLYQTNAPAEPTLTTAKHYLEKNQYRKALYSYRKICANTPTPECWNQLGVTYMQFEKYNQAIKSFRIALAAKKECRFYANLGLAYFYIGDVGQAEDSYRKALVCNPDYSVAKINLAVMLVRQRKYTKGVALLKEVVANEKNNFYAFLFLGYSYYRLKNYSLAEKYLTEGISNNPHYFDLYIYRAHVYYRMNNLGLAENDLNLAENVSPQNPKVRLLRSLIQRKRRDR